MVQFKDILGHDNGARFHNVDLHIHTYGASHDVKDQTMTPENIVESAVKQGLSVIAIADHNSDANVQRALDHAQKNYSGQILILPGIEVTTAHGHLLVYFSPDRTSNLKRFISRLDLIGEIGADNTRTAKSMSDTIMEADRLGGICIAAHIDRERTGFEAFSPGLQNWKRDIITSPGLYGLEADSQDALTWYSDLDTGLNGAERRQLFLARQQVSDLSPRHHLAHVQGSDAHSMQRFEHQVPAKPWTRIKLTELSFSAFRIAMIDPTARVHAKVSIPLAVPRIRGLAITGGFLHGERFHFSDNLNCLIGGRGTGKSTAIRAIAYAFGLNDEFGDYDNCPDAVTVFCEDENGTRYRYVRTRHGEIEVRAKEDRSIIDVPIDAFRIEYFGQGELAKIAEDPFNHPELLQSFLDRHTNLRDLIDAEQLLLIGLRENAARLDPLETSFLQLPGRKKSLAEIEVKLKIAEEGNLREIVRMQSRLASEKTVRDSVEKIAKDYTTGFSLAGVQRNFDHILTAAGVCTDDAGSVSAIAAIGSLLARNNAAVKQIEVELNALAKSCAQELEKLARELKGSHQRMSSEVAQTIADLKSRGLATDLPGLESLLREKTLVATEVAAVEQRIEELEQYRKQRAGLRADLKRVRDSMTIRRKAQLRAINTNLRTTMKDYTIFVKYDDSGITTGFETFLRQELHGSYIQDSAIQNICARITPSDLADWALARNYDAITEATGLSLETTQKMVEKICYWNTLFNLQALSKQPKPVITVRTKSTPPKNIPVRHLSDGQRHTILLTIAMLAESNVPLVIDQPEDDLDNAFIFSSVVNTLRSIKGKRQVIVVTHNANIAVLGDAELILPMHRVDDLGKTRDRGSIDMDATKKCVMNILEGGPEAFQRRKQMYNH